MNSSLVVGVPSTFALLGIVMFCASGCGGQHGAMKHSGSVSVQDIDKLAPDSTLDDVSQVLEHTPLMKLPWFEYPDKEGGILVFAFIPTNELAHGFRDTRQTLTLVAVVKSQSHEAFMQGEGLYVYPKNMAGVRLTGFPLPTTTNPE